VVIAVIALLAALLLPALSQANDKARTIVCRSNLWQTSMGYRLRMDDDGSEQLGKPVLMFMSGVTQSAAFQRCGIAGALTVHLSTGRGSF
jgi:hypothetical protein